MYLLKKHNRKLSKQTFDTIGETLTFVRDLLGYDLLIEENKLLYIEENRQLLCRFRLSVLPSLKMQPLSYFKDVYIYEKQGKGYVKVDVDVYALVEELINTMHIVLRYGVAVKEVLSMKVLHTLPISFIVVAEPKFTDRDFIIGRHLHRAEPEEFVSLTKQNSVLCRFYKEGRLAVGVESFKKATELLRSISPELFNTFLLKVESGQITEKMDRRIAIVHYLLEE